MYKTLYILHACTTTWQIHKCVHVLQITSPRMHTYTHPPRSGMEEQQRPPPQWEHVPPAPPDNAAVLCTAIAAACVSWQRLVQHGVQHNVGDNNDNNNGGEDTCDDVCVSTSTRTTKATTSSSLHVDEQQGVVQEQQDQQKEGLLLLVDLVHCVAVKGMWSTMTVLNIHAHHTHTHGTHHHHRVAYVLHTTQDSAVFPCQPCTHTHHTSRGVGGIGQPAPARTTTTHHTDTMHAPSHAVECMQTSLHPPMAPPCPQHHRA